MTPELRRTAVLLSLIPAGHEVEIEIYLQSGSHTYKARIDEIREDQNIVTFKTPDGNPMRRLPLDQIQTVYEDLDDKARTYRWRITAKRFRFK